MSPPDDLRDPTATDLSEAPADAKAARMKSIGPESEVRGGAQATGQVTRGPAKTATEARQGVMLGTMRWVLGISISLAIVAMAIAYFVA